MQKKDSEEVVSEDVDLKLKSQTTYALMDAAQVYAQSKKLILLSVRPLSQLKEPSVERRTRKRKDLN